VEPAPRYSNTPTVFQLVLGIISFVLVVISTVTLIVLSFASQQLDQATLQTVKYLTWIIASLAIPAIFSTLYAIRGLFPKPGLQPPKSRLFLTASLFLIGLLPLAWLTTLPAFEPAPAWFKALASLLFVGVTAWWLVELGQIRLPRLSRQRQWGLVNFANFVSMPVILLVEMVVLALGLGLLIAWLMKKPEYAFVINQVQNLMYVNPSTLPLIIDQLKPLAQDPAVIAAILVAFSLVIPLIEEFLKPLALWFFVKRQWSPAEGFIAGMVCGAAFAVVESLTALASVGGNSWLALVAARTGTALLHITTAGLSGWALTSSWRDGSYLRVGFTYLLVVFLHGAWNFLAVAVAAGSLMEGNSPNFFSGLAPVAPWLMGVLVAAFFATLMTMNYRLRQQEVSTIPPQLPPALPE